MHARRSSRTPSRRSVAQQARERRRAARRPRDPGRLGDRAGRAGNAISLARTPCFDDLVARYGSTQLRASGPAVGLPEGQMGNSEVGHLTIGSGRILLQDLVRVTRAVEDGSLFANEALLGAFRRAKERDAAVHLRPRLDGRRPLAPRPPARAPRDVPAGGAERSRPSGPSRSSAGTRCCRAPQMRVERVALEDHRDVTALRREVVDDAVADPDDAVADGLEAGDHAERGRLAAAGRADEHHELAVRDVEIEPVDGRVPSRKCFETFSNATLAMVYSFTAPPTRPRTSARCEKMKTIATGTTAISVASASSGLKILTDWPPPPTAGLNDGVDESRSQSPTVIGYWFEFASTTYGRKKLFQSATKLKKKTSATTGFASGSATRQEGLQLAAAVDPRGVEQAGRERGRVVEVGEVDAEREERERQDHREHAPDQVQGVQLEEDRKHERGRRA